MSFGKVVPLLLGATVGVDSFAASPGLLRTTDDDLFLFGVGVGAFRSSFPFGGVFLLSGARSDFGWTVAEAGGEALR